MRNQHRENARRRRTRNLEDDIRQAEREVEFKRRRVETVTLGLRNAEKRLAELLDLRDRREP